MTTNYAVSKHKPRTFLFFDDDVPGVVRQNPLDWAIWAPVNSDGFRLIGETPTAFCTRTNHRLAVSGCTECSGKVVQTTHAPATYHGRNR